MMIALPTKNLYQKSLKTSPSMSSLDELIENIKNENFKELEDVSNLKRSLKQILQNQPKTKIVDFLTLVDKKLSSAKNQKEIKTLYNIKNALTNKLSSLKQNRSSLQLKSVIKEIENITKEIEKSTIPVKKELLKNLDIAKNDIKKLIDNITKQSEKGNQNHTENKIPKTVRHINIDSTHQKSNPHIDTEKKLSSNPKWQNIEKTTQKNNPIRSAKLSEEDLSSISLKLKQTLQSLSKQSYLKNNTSYTKENNQEIKNLKIKITNILDEINNLTTDHKTSTKNISKDIIQTLKEHINANQTKKINLTSKLQTAKIIDNISKQINVIKNMTNKNPTLKEISKNLDNFTKNINSIDLKKNIANSGLFLESKLKNPDIPKQNIEDDLKAVLYKLKELSNQPQNSHFHNIIDKTITDIQTLQLNSIINSNITMFLPFEWDSLKNGTMSFYNSKTKKNFSCKIDLELEKYGKIDIMIILDEYSCISMGFTIENKEFQKIIKQNINELKEAMSNINLNVSIFFNHQKRSNLYQIQEDLLDIGMDFKV